MELYRTKANITAYSPLPPAWYNTVMTPGETFISMLLIVIAYLLYMIAKQLSYLTGKRLKISFMHWGTRTNYPLRKPRKEEPPEKLPN